MAIALRAVSGGDLTVTIRAGAGQDLSRARIQEQLGLEQANVSQHLSVLRAKDIVVGRKEGNQVFYSLRDRAFGKILDLMRQFFEAHVREALAVLKDIEAEE